MTTPPLDLPALREAANAATQSNWTSYGYRVETVPEFDLHRFDVMGEMVAECDLREEDARHIATFDPPTVLALLARAEAAEAAIARVEAICQDTDGNWLDPEDEVNNVGSILQAVRGGGA